MRESDDVCIEEPMMAVEGACAETTQDGGHLFNGSALAYLDGSASCTGAGLPAGYLAGLLPDENSNLDLREPSA